MGLEKCSHEQQYPGNGSFPSRSCFKMFAVQSFEKYISLLEMITNTGFQISWDARKEGLMHSIFVL